MKAGPKAAADLTPLPWKPRSKGSDQLRLFAKKYLLVPRGKGARQPMILRDWQVELASTLLDDPRALLATWVLPRGQGKSGLAAAIGLHHVFMSGIEGARCAIVAQDERSATRLLKSAVRMVELNEELACRCRVYKDRIEIPGTDSVLMALPGEAHRVEGEDLTLAIIDEVGFVPSDTFEATLLSTGKREGSKTLCIGTPSPAKWREKSSLWDLVVRGRSDPDDPTFNLVEYGADDELDIRDPKTWEIANPAYGDWLTEETFRSQLANTREPEFRRARLGQWVESSIDPLLPVAAWKRCERRGVRIPKGARVVIALDGSATGDSTALLVGSVSAKPHVQIGGLWIPADEGGEVNHLEVEDRIRELADYFQVVEIVADPFRWKRSLLMLEEEGLPVYQFDQTIQRLTPSTNDLRAAVVGGLLTHSGEKKLNDHVLRASVEQTTRGIKISKPTKELHIDLAATLIMGFSRIQWNVLTVNKPKAKKVKAFRK